MRLLGEDDTGVEAPFVGVAMDVPKSLSFFSFAGLLRIKSALEQNSRWSSGVPLSGLEFFDATHR